MAPWRIRTKYIILPSVQYRMIGAAVFLSILQTLAIQLVIDRFGREMASLAKAAGLNDSHPMTIFLGRQIERLVSRGWILGAILAVVTFVAFLVLSHQIAGPAYRIKITIAAWLRGENVPLKLRSGDVFTDLAADIQKYHDSRKA